MVFKGAKNKAAVIRAVTYDLLFNNMKSIVTKTAGKMCAPVTASHINHHNYLHYYIPTLPPPQSPPIPTTTITVTLTPPSPPSTLLHTIAELKKRYEKAANKIHRRNGVVSRMGIDCSLKEHRARWKRMEEARLVSILGVGSTS